MASSGSQSSFSKLSRNRTKRRQDSSTSGAGARPSRSAMTNCFSTLAQNSDESASENEKPLKRQIDQVANKVKRMKLSENEGDNGDAEEGRCGLLSEIDFNREITIPQEDSDNYDADVSQGDDELDESCVLDLEADFTLNSSLSSTLHSQVSSVHSITDIETEANMTYSDEDADMSIDDIVVPSSFSIDKFNANSSSNDVM